MKVCRSKLAIDVLVTAPLARGKWQCGAPNWLDSMTARERLFGVDDRRGVSTTGDVVVTRRTSEIGGSPPDAWSWG